MNATAHAAPDMPPEVQQEKSGAISIYRNEAGFWEADFNDGIVMIYIPAGEFSMGCDNTKPDEAPKHTVFLDGFWMAKYPVTIRQYIAFVRETSNRPMDNLIARYAPVNSHPVVGVSWQDAVAYCDWLSTKKKIPFNLPIEAQWEKACRGIDQRQYPWQNLPPDKNLANFGGYLGHTSEVGSFPNGASPYGLLDMAGNVWEWCLDWYGLDYYNNSPLKKPQGPQNGNKRVIRGGSWYDGASNLRCAVRCQFTPAYRENDLGFRLCHPASGPS